MHANTKPPTRPVPGEAEAVERLLPLARAKARNFARRKHADPEDAYADALLGLLQAVRSFDQAGDSPLAAWASRRMTGAMLDGMRERDHASRSSREKGTAAPAALPLERPDLIASRETAPGAALEQAEDALAILCLLKADTRHVLRRRVLDGVLQMEAGAELGVKHSMAQVLYKRAVTHLRAVLERSA